MLKIDLKGPGVEAGRTGWILFNNPVKRCSWVWPESRSGVGER